MESPDKKGSKKNLTLGLNKEVIEKAKAAGINISDITEELLTAVTYNPQEGSTWIRVVNAYDELFDTMKPLLSKYDISLEVGRHEVGVESQKELIYSYILSKDGLNEITIKKNGREYTSPTDVGDIQYSLYEPEKILENLILSLISRVEKNNEKVRELDLALRFVQGLWLADYHKEEQVQ